MAALVLPLHQNEGNAVDDQHSGHHGGGVQMVVHPVVKQHTHYAGGDDGHNDLGPQAPGALFLLGSLVPGEGIQLVEEQHHNGQNGTQLDDHIEHGFEFGGHVQGHKFVQQDQVPRGGNGQPLRNALHNAEENGF